jgi:hypothetical protein
MWIGNEAGLPSMELRRFHSQSLLKQQCAKRSSCGGPSRNRRSPMDDERLPSELVTIAQVHDHLWRTVDRVAVFEHNLAQK